MSSVRFADRGSSAASGVPFAAFVAPMGVAGESVYFALEAALRAARRAFWLVHLRMQEHRTVHLLSGLDDHLLKDIGVRRAEIRRHVRRIIEGRELPS